MEIKNGYDEAGAFIYTLTGAEQLVMRDTMRRLMPVPVNDDRISKDLSDRRRLFEDLKEYSIAASELFKDMLPEAAEAVERMPEQKNWDRRPILIDSIRLGYIRHGDINGGIAIVREKNRAIRKFHERDIEIQFERPEIFLGMAISGLLGSFFINNNLHFTINSRYGAADRIHDHFNQYSVVIGRHGVEGVNTNIWYTTPSFDKDLPPPSFKAELHRGSLLIIPPGMFHSVDGFDIRKKLTNEGARSTSVFFVNNSVEFKKDPETIKKCREKYILPAVQGIAKS